MNWSAVGLVLDLLGVLCLAATTIGWRTHSEKMFPGSWLTHGPVGDWARKSGRDLEPLRRGLERGGWGLLFVGFGLQLLAVV